MACITPRRLLGCSPPPGCQGAIAHRQVSFRIPAYRICGTLYISRWSQSGGNSYFYEPPQTYIRASEVPRPRNFFRNYIPDMAKSTDNAFNALRQALTREPVLLAYPNWNKPFYLQMDASRIVVSGILSQR